MDSTLVILGADHNGLRLKEELARYLASKKVAWIDLGAHELDKSDDYPIYAKKVADFVVRKKALGILVCGTGSGMCMAANKVRGIRAAAISSLEAAVLARKKDDINVLCLGSQFTAPGLAKRIVDIFLKQRFEGGRHLRRLNQIKRLEN